MHACYGGAMECGVFHALYGFANFHVGGNPRSMDGGRTWQPTIDAAAAVL
jgi:hypothetical protein